MPMRQTIPIEVRRRSVMARRAGEQLLESELRSGTGMKAFYFKLSRLSIIGVVGQFPRLVGRARESARQQPRPHPN